MDMVFMILFIVAVIVIPMLRTPMKKTRSYKLGAKMGSSLRKWSDKE